MFFVVGSWLANIMGILSNLTIVIPSYNRQDYLMRQIDYWENYDAKILILDGTKLANHKLKNSKRENIRVIHLPESIEKRFGLAATMINTKYAAMLSDDEFFLPSSLKTIIKFLEDNPDYSACKGNAVGFAFDSRGNRGTGIEIYQELIGYEIANNTPIARMIEHMTDYAMASLWAVHRADVLKKSLTLAGSRSPYASAASFEIQLSLITAWLGKIKVLNELMWLRSYENKNIWWSTGNLSIADWLSNEKYESETTQFVGDLADTISASKQEISRALGVYVEFCSNREAHHSVFQEAKNQIAGFIPEFMAKFVRDIITALKNSGDKSKGSLLEVVQKLSSKGVFVNFDEVREIEKIIKNFHSYSARIT